MSTAALPWARASSATVPGVDVRRALQLALGGLWLLDGILQLQPFMFTRGFADQVLAPAAAGNPEIVAGPITAVARLVGSHPAPANAAFATAQIALGLGIAWRPTLRPALAASVAWALAVWWLGEGLGGILTGRAGPLTGGPGAALLYALGAVLVWPTAGTHECGSVASSAIGDRAARIGWIGLWALLAGFAIDRTGRSAQSLHDALAGMTAGQPAWLAVIGNHAAAIAGDHSTAVAIGLAVGCATIAFAAFAPPALMRAAVVAAVLLAATTWLVAQALGGLVGGEGTDPGTGPLLVLIALAFWPVRTATGDRGGAAW